MCRTSHASQRRRKKVLVVRSVVGAQDPGDADRCGGDVFACSRFLGNLPSAGKNWRRLTRCWPGHRAIRTEDLGYRTTTKTFVEEALDAVPSHFIINSLGGVGALAVDVPAVAVR